MLPMIDFSQYIGMRFHVTYTYGYIKMDTVTREISESLQADNKFAPHPIFTDVYYKVFDEDASVWLLIFETSNVFNEPMWWWAEQEPIANITTSESIHNRYRWFILQPLYQQENKL